MTVICRYKM